MRHWHWWICTLHCWTDSTSSTNDKCRWCDVFRFGIQLIHFVTHILSHLKSYSCFISKKVELVTYAKKSQPETLRTERRMPNLRCLKQRCVVLMWHGDGELWLIFVFGLLIGHPQFHSSTKRMDSGGSTLGAPMHISCYLTCSFLCFFCVLQCDLLLLRYSMYRAHQLRVWITVEIDLQHSSTGFISNTKLLAETEVQMLWICRKTSTSGFSKDRLLRSLSWVIVCRHGMDGWREGWTEGGSFSHLIIFDGMF